jgi:hypothetical protein
LFALFSIVTLLAAQLGRRACRIVQADSWYRKPRPTFTDALAAVRRHIWQETGLLTSRRSRDIAKPPPALQRCLSYALCHAA